MDSISNSLTTIQEMLTDRKADVSGFTKELIPSFVQSNVHKSVFEVIVNKIKIIFYLPPKFKWTELKKYLEEDDETYETILLVVKEKISQNNLKLLSGLALPIQIFDIKELQFNISKHTLVPKHELVENTEDVQKIIQQYSVKSKFHLPHILKSDPMSRYLGLKSGDIVRITRISPTAGEYIVYRCCL